MLETGDRFTDGRVSLSSMLPNGPSILGHCTCQRVYCALKRNVKYKQQDTVRLSQIDEAELFFVHHLISV